MSEVLYWLEALRDKIDNYEEVNILKNKKNVFSDNRYEINILVYTESFLKENEAIEFLKKADELTGINIYFMPLISDEITMKRRLY